MSLRVWLPLNGDLRNQGLNDVTVTNNGATVNDNGKFGKCYYLNGTSTSYINTGYLTNIGTNDFSISLWVKIPTISSGSYYAICTSKASSAISVGFGIYWNYNQKKFLWSTADGSGSTEIWMANTVDNIVYDKWIHLVMVRNSNDAKIGYFYINNIRYELVSVPHIRDIATPTNLLIGKTSSNNYCVKMYINDFRVYDHALSQQEIKKISQGLILHYPLNNRGLGNVNLAYNTKNLSPGASSQVEYKAYKVGLLDVTDGETVTISFDLDMTINIANNYLLVYNANKKGPHRIQSVLALPNESVSVGDHIQKRVSVVTTISDRTTGVTETEDWIEFYSNYDTENEIIINNIKVERGDKATTWSPSPFDDLYITTLQLNDTSVKDISGFNNNANYNNLNGVDFAQVGQALVGTSHNFTFNIDTPIYEVGTNFNHTDNYIIGQSPSLQGRTVTCWIKFKERGNQVAFIDYKSGCSFGIYNTYVPVACKSISYHQCYNRDIFVANTWYFIAVVRDDDNEKVDLYVNGEKQTPVSSTDYWSTNVSDKLTVGARTNGTTLFNGIMSDFRIYATKLSEDDIKKLYEYRS